MTLRAKLVVALMLAAILPMVVTVAVPLIQAEKRAQEDAARRLDLAREQASQFIAREESDAVARVELAASDLESDGAGFESLLQGPAEAARDVTASLADRHGLDHLEILNDQGTVLSASYGDLGAGLSSPFADLGDGAPAIRALPPFAADARAVGFFARRPAVRDDETLSVIGGRNARPVVVELNKFSGNPAELVSASGEIIESAGEPIDAAAALSGEVRIGEGDFAVRVQVPAGDARQVRRELLGAFAGVAPFALVSALVVGVLIAQGIARPVRALASRAEEIASERTGPSAYIPEQDEVRRLTLAFYRMLDALSHSESQRLSAERIAAWQEVARRIAHEVKNPLSPIKLAVENLRRTREQAPESFDRALEEETTAILEEVESLRRLVNEFSDFARLPSPHPVSCNPKHVVAQALALFSSRIEVSNVRVSVRDEDAPDEILADPDQIGRALKNIVSNALDAMESVPDRRLDLTVRRAGAAFEIEVRDTGVGLDEEALQRIFEPYFTTRADRGGTGLGMAIAHRIATEHGGTIEAKGSPGRGTTITLRLPSTTPIRDTR